MGFAYLLPASRASCLLPAGSDSHPACLYAGPSTGTRRTGLCGRLTPCPTRHQACVGSSRVLLSLLDAYWEPRSVDCRGVQALCSWLLDFQRCSPSFPCVEWACWHLPCRGASNCQVGCALYVCESGPGRVWAAAELPRRVRPCGRWTRGAGRASQYLDGAPLDLLRFAFVGLWRCVTAYAHLSFTLFLLGQTRQIASWHMG